LLAVDCTKMCCTRKRKWLIAGFVYLWQETALQDYADFIHIATAFDVTVKGTKDIEQTYQHPFNPSIKERPPLFTLELGPVDGAFGFSTSVDEFEATPIALFSQALELLHEVPQVESSVLKRLFLGKQKYLSSVKVSEQCYFRILRGPEAPKLPSATALVEQYLDLARGSFDAVRLATSRSNQCTSFLTVCFCICRTISLYLLSSRSRWRTTSKERASRCEITFGSTIISSNL